MPQGDVQRAPDAANSDFGTVAISLGSSVADGSRHDSRVSCVLENGRDFPEHDAIDGRVG